MNEHPCITTMTDLANRPRDLKIVKTVSAVGCATFLASLLYFLYLSGNSPIMPNPSTGQIFQLNNHGHIFYVRAWESVLNNFGFVSLICTALFGAYKKAWAGASLNLSWA